MRLPVERWYPAIEKRHAVRRYDGRPVEEEKLDRIAALCRDFAPPGARAALGTEEVESAFKGLVGSYGKVTGATAYVAFVGDTTAPHHLENVGYMGEGIVLEVVSLGLSTSWIGASINRGAVAKLIGIVEEEFVYAVAPIGYPMPGSSLSDRIIKGIARSHERKALDKLVGGLSRERWPEWVTRALEAARVAPSAVNRQPWRFFVEEDSITVSVDDLIDTYNLSKRLDCGIAMLHIELGARFSGVDGQWEYLEPPQVARFKVLT